MAPSQAPEAKAVSRAKPEHRQRRHPAARLNPSMASDTAFRLLARRFLDHVAANHAATCDGDVRALHQMRIALTRLRTAISFFSPVDRDPERPEIKRELKWLNAHLGAARDVDVMVARFKGTNKRRPQPPRDIKSLEGKREKSRRRLTRALRSVRYRRLVEKTSTWLETGLWSTRKGKQATEARASPIAAFSARRLRRWRKKLLKKSNKLSDMGANKRHRLRLANKKLFYSTEFVADFFPAQRNSRQEPALKYLRQAQKSLGQLNDNANSQSFANHLKQDGIQTQMKFLGPKRERRLIQKAAQAYRKLARLEPLRT